MKLKFVKAAAALTIAASAVLAPVAANAATVEPYPPAGSVIVTGNTVNITFGPGSFAGAENVTIYLTGFNAGGASLATVKSAATAVELGTVTSNAAGGATVTITLPSNATGTYTVTGISASRPEGVSVTFTIAGAAAGGSGSLPATGMDSGSLLGLWAGGGALVLAGGAVAVGAAVHRQRKQAA
jgi:hypothetical protein